MSYVEENFRLHHVRLVYDKTRSRRKRRSATRGRSIRGSRYRCLPASHCPRLPFATVLPPTLSDDTTAGQQRPVPTNCPGHRTLGVYTIPSSLPTASVRRVSLDILMSSHIVAGHPGSAGLDRLSGSHASRCLWAADRCCDLVPAGEVPPPVATIATKSRECQDGRVG